MLFLAPGVAQQPVDILEDRFATLRSLPQVGTYALYGVIVLAAVTFAICMAAARRPRFLQAARSAAFATCALIVFDLLLLAYAFVSHDFRIRYVARYSDRSMSTGYLLTALWGGQDGSLLWWIFLLSLNTTAAVVWLKGKYRELQPYVIATLMAIIAFFVAIMTMSANPFWETIAGATVDGEGLNPLLQNFYMIIHPPSLYTGFVATSVPFAFAVAALASGRLDEDWLSAVRKWMLFAWTFLSIGNALGMLWAYEELGWGGYWAWDPVENAAFMPWLTASAFVHSTMIQERRRMLKVWNVFLVIQTFFMTIVGTFLTRSGMIASVHAFAQSSIGIYFTYMMVTVVSSATALVVYRLPELKNVESATKIAAYQKRVGPALSKLLLGGLGALIILRIQTPKMAPIAFLAIALVASMVVLGLVSMKRFMGDRPDPEFDAVLSREAAFIANNWVLLAMQLFILIATIFPLISEEVTGEKITVGPAFYNRWITPLGLILYALMGIGPLLGWRKTSGGSLKRALRVPLLAMAAMAALHIGLGKKLGFPAFVPSDPIYPGILGTVLQKMGAVAPLIATVLSAFNIAVIVQEYVRGVKARQRAQSEGVLTAIRELLTKSRRRYGGYIVHLGIVLMFLGFTGSSWHQNEEFAMYPGDTVKFQGYELTYIGTRREVDPAKMMVFADVRVRKDGQDLGTMSPAKFVFTKKQMPTSEVSIRAGLHDDLYIAPGNMNPTTKLATLQVHMNPLTSWIWAGVLVLLLGSLVALWPQVALGEVGAMAWLRTAGGTAASLVFAIMLATTPTRAFAQQSGTSSSHAGTVSMKTGDEKKLFTNLLCMCGGCDRLPLSGCVCDWAESMRTELSARLGSGESIQSIEDTYVKRFGTMALNVPPSRGFLRSIWILPVGLIVAGAAGAFVLVRRWSKKPVTTRSGATPKRDLPRDDYDDRLDAELTDIRREERQHDR